MTTMTTTKVLVGPKNVREVSPAIRYRSVSGTR